MMKKILFVGLFSVLYGCSWMESSPKIYLKLQGETDLSSGDKVKISGVEVGKVTDLSLKNQAVIAELEIQKDISIPKDSRFYVKADGIVMPEIYVQVKNGTSIQNLAPGDTIMGESQSDLLHRLQEALLESMGVDPNQAGANGSPVITPPPPVSNPSESDKNAEIDSIEKELEELSGN
ncbi:MAG: hypothetical protein C4K58_00075 [Flavobacteriaceae bacterium]|nr:MAG: hypothetical protein C4K58_00075 [Flavobacteriaceae bacterium]